jgi:hypothetical protein
MTLDITGAAIEPDSIASVPSAAKISLMGSGSLTNVMGAGNVVMRQVKQPP